MKIHFISLGCDKNLVDSEYMLGILQKSGHELIDNEQEADAIVINTCCFIHDAKEESIQTILEMAQIKKIKEDMILLVAGCLAQRYRQEILDQIPEVDGLIGTTGYEDIVKALESAAKKKHISKEWYKDINYLPTAMDNRVLTTGGTFAYIKIAEGCDKHCTYCAIPGIRGSYRSVPMDMIMKEAKELVEQGCRELIIVAQETTVYGTDIYGEKRLSDLLHQLCGIQGLMWIRIMYCYPEEITNDLIQIIKTEEKICKYIDLPIQHASDTILKRMGRQTTGSEIRQLIKNIRKEIPDIAIRTSLITGFPGETEDDFAELKAFVKEIEFERLGVFTYSKEEGTPAAKLRPQITKKVKEARRKEIMLLQQEIAFRKAENMIGKQLIVHTVGTLTGESVYVGRSYMDAPNVDGFVFFTAGLEPVSGDFVKVMITGAKEYDLIGEAI